MRMRAAWRSGSCAIPGAPFAAPVCGRWSLIWTRCRRPSDAQDGKTPRAAIAEAAVFKRAVGPPASDQVVAGWVSARPHEAGAARPAQREAGG
eukprot:CAMPEP_0179255920 /NCGR_PEP_ID=MMETSP0797-20121207/23999_1 /TAXON_ID=47934 /ORGANISM="Dinophysis acuminata, Strain DAEP01" /LENGTH=92 /DNA_ID=CAMNT_0020963837 /DNA_START=27 /DNA_END=303 /DNA_ORIENTATION=+